MPTLWNTLYLGVQPIIDPTEGNTTADNANALVGMTFGGPNDKLFDEVVAVQTINVGGNAAGLEQNNTVANDQITFDLGNGPVTTTYDAGTIYNATITYTDGSTYTGTVFIGQDTLGNTFLVPQVVANASHAAMMAKPIESLTLNSVFNATFNTTTMNRQEVKFLACFTYGTGVLTPEGVRRIETLAPGDLVMTHDHGAQALRWIGRTGTRGQGDHAPIRFAPGSIGNDRALRVSPQHRMLVTDWRAELLFGEAEVLVPAKFLVGRPGVTVAPCAALTYVHLMFDRHEMIFAGGAWSESFFPGEMALSGDPGQSAEIEALFPDLLARATQPGCPPAYGPTARRVLSQTETRALLMQDAAWTMAA